MSLIFKHQMQAPDMPPQPPQQQPPQQPQRAPSRGPPVSMDRMDRYRPQHRGARAGSAMGRAHSLNRAGHYDPRMPMEENEYYENSVTFQVSSFSINAKSLSTALIDLI